MPWFYMKLSLEDLCDVAADDCKARHDLVNDAALVAVAALVCCCIV